MNVALPALLFFLIVLPGFLFRSRLKLAEQTSLDYSPFGRVVTEALLWSIALHGVWLALASTAGITLRTDALLGLMSSSADRQAVAIDAVSASSLRVFAYFTSLYVFAFVVPYAVRVAISRARLDRAGAPLSSIFRFHEAPWYYLLTGADFAEAEQPDYILVAAIVDVAGAATLYVGTLADFFFDPDGHLDRVVLENVSRRPISSDKRPDDHERFYPIEGDYFVIRYAEATTLNVQYVKLQEADESEAA